MLKVAVSFFCRKLRHKHTHIILRRLPKQGRLSASKPGTRASLTPPHFTWAGLQCSAAVTWYCRLHRSNNLVFAWDLAPPPDVKGRNVQMHTSFIQTHTHRNNLCMSHLHIRRNPSTFQIGAKSFPKMSLV